MLPYEAERGRTMTNSENPHLSQIESYDTEAEKTGWYGPEVAFGLAYQFIKPGQTMLDIGIGTGLGSALFRRAGLEIYGLDLHKEMLDICRQKGLTNLEQHDLTQTPYPYRQNSLDHAISTGVFNFFSNLDPVFREVSRIIKPDGLFIFATGDRTEDQPHAITIGREHTHSDATITMYIHSSGQIKTWLKSSSLTLKRDMAFTMYMDSGKKHARQVRVYLAEKKTQ